MAFVQIAHADARRPALSRGVGLLTGATVSVVLWIGFFRLIGVV
ncbi:hypothetical protein [Phenylobacterium sp. J367]|nr:hypothetical protein [Phenylobacterium sp. J367]